MVTTRSPLEDRVLLWTGMMSKPQLSELDPYIRCLPPTLTGTCRSLTRLTRTLCLTFRSLAAEAAASGPQDDASSLSPIADNLHYWDLLDEARLDPPNRVEDPDFTLRRGCDPLVRLLEEGDFG